MKVGLGMTARKHLKGTGRKQGYGKPIAHRLRGITAAAVLTALAAVICLPVALLCSGSLTGEYEMHEQLLPMLRETERYISWRWIPRFPDFSQFGRLLFRTPQFFVLFWNSLKITGLILVGQLLTAVLAAWAFSRYSFRLKRLLFTIYIVLMLLPFQVTMLSQYLVLDRAGLLNTQWAVILPAAFSTFPVFLIYRSFCGIPDSLVEAARIDGAGEWYCFFHIGLPLAEGGILSAAVLNFLECWNLIEQPLAFLKDRAKWPLSLYLPQIGVEQAGFAMAASVITLLPALCVFAFGQDYLEQGISTSGLKA